MGSFIARYHELTKYDPRSILHLGPVLWDQQPEPFKEIAGDEIVDLAELLPFLDQGPPAGWSTGALLPGGPPDLSTIARVSWFAAGINAVLDGTHPPVYLRANPSAGGLYPIELYWAVFDLPGLEPGFYHFHPSRIGLVPVWRGRFRDDMAAILGGDDLGRAPAAAVLTGIFARSAWRYKERAYRRMLLDAGHLAANLCLVADAEGIGADPTTAFADASLSELLFLDPSEEVPLLVVPLRPREPGTTRSARSPAVPREAAVVPEGRSFQVHAHHLADLPHGPLERLEPAGVLDGIRPEDVPLDGAAPDLPARLHASLAERRSTRAFRRSSIPFDAFAGAVRWAFEGLAPHAGAGIDPLALSTWVVVHDVEDVPTGVWKLDPLGRFLSPVRIASLREECATACLGQELAREAGAVFFHAAPLDSLVARSGERVYRSLCMDSGHLGQRLALAAHAFGLGFSGIGGYFDDEVNRLLGVHEREAILYATVLGAV